MEKHHSVLQVDIYVAQGMQYLEANAYALANMRWPIHCFPFNPSHPPQYITVNCYTYSHIIDNSG